MVKKRGLQMFTLKKLESENAESFYPEKLTQGD